MWSDGVLAVCVYASLFQSEGRTKKCVLLRFGTTKPNVFASKMKLNVIILFLYSRERDERGVAVLPPTPKHDMVRTIDRCHRHLSIV